MHNTCEMDAEKLRELITGAGSLTLEFKRHVDDRELVEAVVCFQVR